MSRPTYLIIQNKPACLYIRNLSLLNFANSLTSLLIIIILDLDTTKIKQTNETPIGM